MMDDNFPSMMRERFELGLGVQWPIFDFTCLVIHYSMFVPIHSVGRHALGQKICLSRVAHV